MYNLYRLWYNIFSSKRIICMHEHHRDRLRDKAVKDVSLLTDVELLEIILFGCIPRRNTNELAHKLIHEFGSIASVFSANPEHLATIDGIGPTTAAHIAALNRILCCIEERNDLFPKFFSFNEICAPLVEFFKGYKEEVFLAFFLDKKQKILARKIVLGHETYSVEIDLNDFAKQIVMMKPAFVAIAHNHLFGGTTPSEFDDVATQKIAVVAELNGAVLLDHLVVCQDKVYSYYYDHRFELLNINKD